MLTYVGKLLAHCVPTFAIVEIIKGGHNYDATRK